MWLSSFDLPSSKLERLLAPGWLEVSSSGRSKKQVPSLQQPLHLEFRFLVLSAIPY